MTSDNYTVVDLNKVSYAKFYYANQDGDRRRIKPNYETVHNDRVDKNAIVFGTTKTMLVYAAECGILDDWTPVCKLQLSNSHVLRYTGDKAKSIWKEWNKRIFKK